MPYFSFRKTWMPWKIFASPHAIIEPIAPTIHEPVENIPPNNAENNTPQPIDCSKSIYTEYDWQPPPNVHFDMWDWRGVDCKKPSIFDAKLEIDYEGLGLFDYKAKGFDQEVLEAQVDQRAKHTQLFVHDLDDARSNSTPLREIYERRKKDWRKEIDKFCNKFPPSRSWEPDSVSRAGIKKLERLETAMLEAKEELDKSIGHENQLVMDFMQWNMDSEGKKRTLKAEREKGQREKNEYEECVNVMSMMDMSRRRSGSGMGRFNAEGEAKRFSEAMMKQWEVDNGYLVEEEKDDAKGGSKVGQKRKQKKGIVARRKPPFWFLALEERVVIRKQEFEVRGGEGQRFLDFGTWLFEGGSGESIKVRGVLVRRWMFGGEPEENFSMMKITEARKEKRQKE
ncbi:hypothetical protein QBC38DRAFT_440052 [Podospora fimiseda]|uniref:Uncharacterized protein n=1 Tax=Podospora fimiseda TaxID=252190 RepID=A0AAN7BXH2_9PEZI|nr:hypothetical protein QBC38DRAFT_440052 [Podospora fimiseda]